MIDDIKKVLYSEEDIKNAVDRMASEINRDYKDTSGNIVLLCILKGSLPFCADLMRRLEFPVELDCMKASSYGAGTTSSGKLNITLDIIRDDLENTDFIIAEDIMDSGLTLSCIRKMLLDRGARSVKVATLLNNPCRRKADIEPDYQGFIMPNEFVVGYGLDYNEKYRQLPYIGVLKPEIYG